MKSPGHTTRSFSWPSFTSLVVVVLAVLMILTLSQVDAADILSRWKRNNKWADTCKTLRRLKLPQPPQCKSNANWS
ncbi:hypothetical protein RRG08_004022 [Elysia crispata]|uniref:Uncharacterized protein n=1 Tax=Elysia crispata TaxID=231223 RepID=A0AAE1CF37_9GAST|nr:hypothetical protein RRG08_004022 [Elysia crispata]